MHTESIVSLAPWRKGISVKYGTKNMNNIFKDSDSDIDVRICYVCMCKLSNKLVLRRRLETHTLFVFFLDICEN